MSIADSVSMDQDIRRICSINMENGSIAVGSPMVDGRDKLDVCRAIILIHELCCKWSSAGLKFMM